MALDKVLIALHLDRAVSTDILMPIARMRIIENIDSQVKNTIIQRFVLQNSLIHRPFRKLAVEIARGDEMVRIQIALSDREHIQKHQCRDCCGCDISPLTDIGIIAGNVFRLAVRPQNQDIGKQDEEE